MMPNVKWKNRNASKQSWVASAGFWLALFLPALVPAQSSFTWQSPPNSPTTASVKFDDIFFLDSLNGMACNGDGRIHKTVNAGVNWQLVHWNPDAFFRCLVMTDSLHAWVGNFGYYQGSTTQDTTEVYQTTDGGTTWFPAPVPSPIKIGICGLSSSDDQHLYGVGRVQGPASFIRSSDGGTTWSYTNMSSHCGFLVDCYFPRPDTGFVIGGTDPQLAASFPIILHTMNGGTTWDTVFIGTQYDHAWCWKMQFPSDSIGYATTESDDSEPVRYLKTTDGGMSWSLRQLTTTHFNLQGIGFVNDSVGWAGGYYGNNLYETLDGGDTWTAIPGVANLNRIRKINDELLWGSGLLLYRIAIHQPLALPPQMAISTLQMQLRRSPSESCVYVDVKDSKIGAQYQLHLFDVVGREVKSMPLNHPASTRVSLEGIPNTYLYFVVTDGESTAYRLYVPD